MPAHLCALRVKLLLHAELFNTGRSCDIRQPVVLLCPDFMPRDSLPENSPRGGGPPPEARVFLLLQGPHGPFFDHLGRLLGATGATVWRVAFNAGDAFFWGAKDRLILHSDTPEDWPDHLAEIVARKGVTDIVLYGDVRPVHAAARTAAEQYGLNLHVFEEGYLRPFWITYERGGANGHSQLMKIGIEPFFDQLRYALRRGCVVRDTDVGNPRRTTAWSRHSPSGLPLDFKIA
ncbi:MAG: hypothetical protein R3E47_11335 [Paracoccaceae bacterium]